MLTTLATPLKALFDGVFSGITRLFSSSIILTLIACAGVGYYAYKAGNQYGPYARAYKQIVAELNAKNADLARQKAEDEAEIAKAEAERDAAVKAAATVKTCKATKSQAKAINRVKE